MLPGRTRAPFPRPTVLHGLVLCLVLTWHAWTLHKIPEPFVDEAWFGDRAWSLVQSGVPYGTLDHGGLDRYAGSALFYPLLPVVVQGTALAIAGEPSLAALRLVSLAFGIGLLLAVWITVASYYDEHTAFGAAVVLALSQSFLVSSHWARYDVMAAALGFAGMAMFAWGQRQGRSTGALAGFTAGLAVEFHPFSLVIAMSLFFLAAVEHWRDATGRRKMAQLICGLAAGLAVYPIIHILPEPRTYYELTRIIYGPSHVPTLGDLWQGVGQTARLCADMFYGAPWVVFMATLTLAISADRRNRLFAVVNVVLCVAFAVLVRNKLLYYAILFAPACAMTCAVAGRHVVTQWRSRFAVGTVVSLSVGVVLIGNVSPLLWLRTDFPGDLATSNRALAAVLRPSDRIMGTQTYWFAFHDHSYFSWEQLIYLTRERPGSSVTDGLQTMRPDVFIRDRHLDQFIRDDAGDSTYTRVLRLPKTELEVWLAKNSSLILDLEAGAYGRVRAYRISWPTGPGH
jgi:4-amino-4-deoxy-L-arabinose transferase-like glycosyltransferase